MAAYPGKALAQICSTQIRKHNSESFPGPFPVSCPPICEVAPHLHMPLRHAFQRRSVQHLRDALALHSFFGSISNRKELAPDGHLIDHAGHMCLQLYLAAGQTRTKPCISQESRHRVPNFQGEPLNLRKS